jgi:NADH:ubiquinone oxidoreductase subunit
MNFGTTLYTWLYGNLVGKDDQENKYYCNSKKFEDLKAKRWIIFNGDIESTKIPPHWHAWLHKSIDIPPLNYSHKYSWQKDHKQNMTGTDQAYYPDSHPLSKTHNKEAITSEYDSWSP